MTPSIEAWLQGPLHIDVLALPSGGRIGMTHCPGRCTVDARGRAWQRRLDEDVRAIRQAGFARVFTLLDLAELERLGAADLASMLAAAGIEATSCPIMDFGVPDAACLERWHQLTTGIVPELRHGGAVLVHCAAGLGRTGMMTATLLVASGLTADDAIRRVRAARPGTIETPAQEAFVRQFVPR